MTNSAPFNPVGPGGNFRHNAMLHASEDDATIGLGFVSAADTLVENWEGRGPDDTHLMPIIYLYRHGIELLLKAAIHDAARCLRGDGLTDLDLGRDAVDKWLAQKAGHSLQSLATRLDAYLQRLGEETLPVDVHALLTSIHTLDPGGDTFRYAMTRDKATGKYIASPRPSSSHIDVVAMGEQFHQAGYLIGGGVLTMLELYRDAQVESQQYGP